MAAITSSGRGNRSDMTGAAQERERSSHSSPISTRTSLTSLPLCPLPHCLAVVDAFLQAVQVLFQEQPVSATAPTPPHSTSSPLLTDSTVLPSLPSALSQDDYDEETALLFLHRCDYDPNVALALLQPPRTSTAPVDPSLSSSPNPLPPSLTSPHSPSSPPSSPSTPDADTDDVCSICLDGGHLIICEHRGCHRVYHIECAGLRTVPQGRWECPRHSCNACGEEWGRGEGSARKRRRGESGAVIVNDIKTPPSSHPSLISHSQPHLLSPSTSLPTDGDKGRQTSTPHIECTSCPTSYCLAHIPPSVLTVYGMSPSQLGALTREGLDKAVKGSVLGCFLCQSCMQVKERRDRLGMLRRLNEAMEGKSGERLWGAWEAMGGGEDDGDFGRLLHHPTEWRKVEQLLQDRTTVGQQTQGNSVEAEGKKGGSSEDLPHVHSQPWG